MYILSIIVAIIWSLVAGILCREVGADLTITLMISLGIYYIVFIMLSTLA